MTKLVNHTCTISLTIFYMYTYQFAKHSFFFPTMVRDTTNINELGEVQEIRSMVKKTFNFTKIIE